MSPQSKNSTDHKVSNDALLKFFVRASLLTGEAAQKAEAELAADHHAKSAIEWVVNKGIISEDALAHAMAEHLKLPYVNLAAVALDAAATALIREDLAVRYEVVPLRALENSLVIAAANPFDRAAVRAIEFAVGKRVQIEVATVSAIRDALEHAYHLEEALDAYLRGVPDGGEIPIAELHDDAADVKSLLRGTELPPVIKLLNLILLEGIRLHASDVHIEANLTAVQVRYRIDGMLQESFRLPNWVHDPLVARCKILARLDITERRVPQDGRLQVRYRDSTIDLRVSVLPTQFGEKVTMRILNGNGAPSGLDALALSPRDLKCMRHALGRPEGMILVTGPTGSGKTTTLYAMIAEIISPTRNIVTIENPIEFQMRGVNQVEVNEKQGLTFASTLRSILRQDPDVILVGEIRDSETAEIALRAAQTGHLVLSTLHTNDAVSTIGRLVDLGIEPYMMSSSLNLIVGQRLVRHICAACAAPYEPDIEVLRSLQIDPASQQFLKGAGCSQCHKSGYAGRGAVFEVMPITNQFAKLIESKATENALRLQARADGMVSLPESAASKVVAGFTTPEEVLRVIDIALEGIHCPNCHRAVEEAFAMCPHCATPLQHTCSGCNVRLQKEWQICPYCGTAAKGPIAAVAAPAAVAVPSPPPIAENPAPAAEAAREYRALVVDDQADMRKLITFTLEHGGMPISVVQASDGQEALDLAQDDPPDLVLLDVMMPGMDGFEVCEQLRHNVRTAFIPILMLTALDDSGSRARGFLAGTDDYISKPFARAELLARVRRLLQRTYGAILPEPPRAVTRVKRDPPELVRLSA